MSRETKFELAPNVLARDLKDKISFGHSTTVLTSIAMAAFSLVVAAVLIFSAISNIPDRLVFDQGLVGWLVLCFFALSILGFGIFLIYVIADRVSMMKKWERGEFVVLTDRLVSLRIVHHRRGSGGGDISYYACFERYGSCEINAGDSSDPFVDSSSGDEFYLVAFKSARSHSKYKPMLAYNKKRYEYREENG